MKEGVHVWVSRYDVRVVINAEVNSSVGERFRDILDPITESEMRGKKYNARVGVDDVHYQSVKVIYSCPNPSVSSMANLNLSSKVLMSS